MADNRLIYLDPETGLVRASKSAIKQDLKDAVTESYGDVLLDDNYPDGMWINHYADKFNDIFDVVETIYNMLDINNAEGVILDTLGNLRNDHRKGSTSSYLYVDITATASCSFQANKLTLIDENNNYWYLNIAVDIVVPSGDPSATAKAVFRSSNTGVLQEPTQIQIVASQSDLPIAEENITVSIDSFESGQNKESDIVFRNRMSEYAVFNSITLKENLVSRLFNLEYIRDVKIYYNSTPQNIATKGGVTLGPGKMFVLIKVSNVSIFGDTNLDLDEEDNATLKEVFYTIENYKGLGTVCWIPIPEPIPASFQGYRSKSVNTSSSPETEYIYDNLAQFLVPETLTVPGINIKYVKTTYFDENNTENNIKSLIKVFIDNKGIGDDLTIGDLISYIYLNTNEIYVSSLTISGSSSGVLTNPDKILYIDINNITFGDQS